MSIIGKIKKILSGRAAADHMSARNLPPAEVNSVSEGPISSASRDQEMCAAEYNKRVVETSLVAQLEARGICLDGISVEVLDLCIRASKRLRRAQIRTIQQLVSCTEGDLLRIDGLGILALIEIEDKVKSYLTNMLNRGGAEPNTARLNEEIIDTSWLQSIERQVTPLHKTSVQELGLTEQESNELRVFGINTIQELVNCAKHGLLDIPDPEMTTVDEIKKKLKSYLDNLSSGVDWSPDTTQISGRIVQAPLLPIDSSSGNGIPLPEHHSEIAEPSLLVQIEDQGIDLNTISVGWLDLSLRASKRLRATNIDNLQQLVDCAEGDLLGMYGLGLTTFKEIKDKLNACLYKILEGISLKAQAAVQAIQISEQLSELASRLCSNFENHVPLDEIHLPYFAQQSLRKAIDESPQTLADLKQLTELDSSQTNIFESNEQIFDQIRELEHIVDWLYNVVIDGNIDREAKELGRQLDDRERFILINRFGIHSSLTLEMIGEQFHLTRERVRQIESKMRSKLNRMCTRSSLMYSTAGIGLIKYLDEGATVNSWIQRLIEIGFLKEEASADLLVAISRVTKFTPLALPKEFDYLLEPHISPHILLARKPVLSKARKFCRNCGAIRIISLTSEDISEADVEQILHSDGFTEVHPGWWMKEGSKCVAESVATKVMMHCGAVSPANLRRALTRHLSRLQFSAPPSEVLVKVLEHTGNFVLVDGFVKLIRPLTRKPALTGPESIFFRTVQSEGPVVSFEFLHTRIIEEGFSKASVTSLLRYSPIVERIAFGLYTLIGTPYGAGDVERTRSELTRVSADTSMKPRRDGVIEFETNIGTWMIYGGVLSSGPAASLEGNWTLVLDDANRTELVVGGGFIRGLSDAVVSLDLMPMDRIRIEFNTWTREARITKVVDNE